MQATFNLNILSESTANRTHTKKHVGVQVMSYESIGVTYVGSYLLTLYSHSTRLILYHLDNYLVT